MPPTQGKLLELQDDLEGIRDGHRLMDRKRQVLLQELIEWIEETREVQERVQEQLGKAGRALTQAKIHMGVDRVQWISLVPGVSITTRITRKSVMGVDIPLVQMEVSEEKFPYGPGNTSPAVDGARREWLQVLEHLGELSEAITTVWRLAEELRKSQRRVKALEEIVIPRYEATIKKIDRVLAEEERESIGRAKRVKKMRQGGETRKSSGGE